MSSITVLRQITLETRVRFQDIQLMPRFSVLAKTNWKHIMSCRDYRVDKVEQDGDVSYDYVKPQGHTAEVAERTKVSSLKRLLLTVASATLLIGLIGS
jgi:hypothetical protein